jgi:hypothetical protein
MPEGANLRRAGLPIGREMAGREVELGAAHHLEPHYVAGLSLALTREAKRELKLEILNRAKALIEATGAFSGIGQTPSRAEQAVMDEIDNALC